mmetsp:Transcript_63930/g.197977  ORF Transcript_63930/g.197977 Transcript_63930/m.197977 type:complete len:490 (+) Transcript_63930:883-2352(+)
MDRPVVPCANDAGPLDPQVLREPCLRLQLPPLWRECPRGLLPDDPGNPRLPLGGCLALRHRCGRSEGPGLLHQVLYQGGDGGVVKHDGGGQADLELLLEPVAELHRGQAVESGLHEGAVVRVVLVDARGARCELVDLAPHQAGVRTDAELLRVLLRSEGLVVVVLLLLRLRNLLRRLLGLIAADDVRDHLPGVGLPPPVAEPMRQRKRLVGGHERQVGPIAQQVRLRAGREGCRPSSLLLRLPGHGHHLVKHALGLIDAPIEHECPCERLQCQRQPVSVPNAACHVHRVPGALQRCGASRRLRCCQQGSASVAPLSGLGKRLLRGACEAAVGEQVQGIRLAAPVLRPLAEFPCLLRQGQGALRLLDREVDGGHEGERLRTASLVPRLLQHLRRVFRRLQGRLVVPARQVDVRNLQQGGRGGPRVAGLLEELIRLPRTLDEPAELAGGAVHMAPSQQRLGAPPHVAELLEERPGVLRRPQRLFGFPLFHA